MNIKNLSILIISLVSFLSCKNDPHLYVTEVIEAIDIGEHEHFMSKESDIKFGGFNVSMRIKAIYSNGEIKKVLRYYPEGPLTYSLADLEADEKLMSSFSFPKQQDWSIKNSRLRWSEDFEDELIKISDSLYLKQGEGNRVTIYKAKAEK